MTGSEPTPGSSMPGTAAVPRGDDRRWHVWVPVLSALLLAPSLAYRMGVDQGVFAYMGDALLEGRWPYVDTWESDFPGMVLLQAVEILLLGRSIFMFRLFDLVWSVANAYLVFRIADRLGDRAGGMLAAGTFCLVYQGYGPWNTAQRESFGVLFVLLGYWWFLTAERRRPVLTAAGIGTGLGIAALFKPTLLALAALYLPAVRQADLRRPGRTAKRLTVAAAGVLAPAATVVIAYWAMGGLTELYEATIAHQGVYARLQEADAGTVERWLARLSGLGGTAVAMAVAFPPVLLSPRHRRERSMLYVGYLGSLAAVVVQGTFAGYHYIPGLALGSAMIGIGFSEGTHLIAGAARRAGPLRHLGGRLALAHLVLLLAVPVYWRPQAVRDLLSGHFLGPPRPGELRVGTTFDFTESWRVAEYLGDRTEPRQSIQVWGYESLVYYLADRPAASRFHTSHGLVMRVPGEGLPERVRRWRSEFLDDLRSHPPAYVAVVREDGWWWAPGGRTSWQLLDDFPAWKRFLEERYVPDTTIGRFVVYRRARPDGPIGRPGPQAEPRGTAMAALREPPKEGPSAHPSPSFTTAAGRRLDRGGRR